MSRPRKTKKSKLLRPEHLNLHPAQMAGLTVGDEEDTPVALKSADVSHMADDAPLSGGRVPVARFVAESNPGEVWTDGQTDRLQMGVDKTFTRETIQAMQAGYICIRCLEPQEAAFPPQCDLCGYTMRERQIVDLSVEFAGEKHIGPSKALDDYLDELDAEAERKNFQRRIDGGASRMVGLRGRAR